MHALNAASANVSFVEIETDKGHDAFLLNDRPELFRILSGFLNRRGRSSGRCSAMSVPRHSREGA